MKKINAQEQVTNVYVAHNFSFCVDILQFALKNNFCWLFKPNTEMVVFAFIVLVTSMIFEANPGCDVNGFVD